MRNACNDAVIHFPKTTFIDHWLLSLLSWDALRYFLFSFVDMTEICVFSETKCRTYQHQRAATSNAKRRNEFSIKLMGFCYELIIKYEASCLCDCIDLLYNIIATDRSIKGQTKTYSDWINNISHTQIIFRCFNNCTKVAKISHFFDWNLRQQFFWSCFNILWMIVAD